MCGQGDPEPFLKQGSDTGNLKYKPPIHGKERGEFLSELTALVTPSIYIEPFCGVNVEAQLCGVPVISNDFGAFIETLEQFKTGLRFHTLADFGSGVQMALDRQFDRAYVH